MNDGHALVQVELQTPMRATYKCLCGVRGYATMAKHLASPEKLKSTAAKNHELHSARAYRKMLRSQN